MNDESKKSENWRENSIAIDDNKMELTTPTPHTNTDVDVVVDVEDEEMPLICEVENTNHGEDDDDNDEKESSKSRHSSDHESTASYGGPDPMGLLERLDKSNELELGEDDDGTEDESSSSGATRRLTKTERWQIWMARWKWLLHEESDNGYAFCLYCNIIINVSNKSKFIKQHNLSLYHQERESNYIAFKQSKQSSQDVGNNDEVKVEFGTDGYVVAMKQKRAAEMKALNNFNWERWLYWYPWLERTDEDGTVGRCIYCNIRMNVEFTYLRKRHISSKGHIEAERQHQSSPPSRKRKRSTAAPPAAVEETSEETEQAETDTAAVDIAKERDKWFEAIPNTSPAQCRCSLCDIRMVITSFIRHLRSKVHDNALTAYTAEKNRSVWAQYSEIHPWLTADPQEPTIAYCNICEKRFMYGHSELKRKAHENSQNHLMEVAAKNKTPDGANASEQEKQQEQANPPQNPVAESDARSDPDYNSEDMEATTSTKSDSGNEEGGGGVKTRNTKIKPTKSIMVQYGWLRHSKNHKIQFCKYCRVRCYNEKSKARHAQSQQHRAALAEFRASQASLRKQHKRNQSEDNPAVSTEMPSSQQSVQSNLPKPSAAKSDAWKNRYPWIIAKPSETRINYAFCKLCDVSVFLPNFKYASKHQRSNTHIRHRISYKRNGTPKPTEATVVSTPPTGEAKHKAAMKELRAKYEWLDDIGEENYCRCRICETRLPIKLFYLRQHDGSRKHALQVEQLQNEKANSANSALEAEVSVTELERDNDEVQSIKSETTLEETTQEQSHRSHRSQDVRRLLRALRSALSKRTEERSQLDLAKDMICSSFEIVSRLQSLERPQVQQAISHETSTTSSSATTIPSQPQPPPERTTVDLFFESIAQTMKGLPKDMAAEGKAKIMQIICDLEVRAMQRETENSQSLNHPTIAIAANERIADETPPVVLNGTTGVGGGGGVNLSTSTSSSTVTIDDSDEPNNKNGPSQVRSPEIRVVPLAKRPKLSVNQTSQNNSYSGNRSQEETNSNNIGRISAPTKVPLPKPIELDTVRCVSLEKLMNRSVPLNGPKSSTPIQQRSVNHVTHSVSPTTTITTTHTATTTGTSSVLSNNNRSTVSITGTANTNGVSNVNMLRNVRINTAPQPQKIINAIHNNSGSSSGSGSTGSKQNQVIVRTVNGASIPSHLQVTSVRSAPRPVAKFKSPNVSQ